METTDRLQGVKTMSELFALILGMYPNEKCMGERTMVRIHSKQVKQKDGTVKVWTTPEMSPLKWYTYTQISQRLNNFCRGFMQFTNLKSGVDRLAIFENTSLQWMLTAQCAFKYNLTVCTVYANLGLDAMIIALQETGASAILVNVDSLKDFEEISKNCPKLKYVIFTRNGLIDDDKQRESERVILDKLTRETNLQFMSFDEVEHLGEKNQDQPIVVDQPASNNSVALIMYTSGTTGKPKGAMLSHKNIIAAISSFDDVVGEDKDIPYVYVAYLPLAHIMELVAEHMVLVRGGSIGYGSPRTLTDTGAKPCGDIGAIRPSLLVGVPKVWDTIKKGARERMENSNFIVRWLFNAGFAAKYAALKEGKDTPLWNLLVFNNFRKLIGGRMALMLSGGAPLNKDSQIFMRVCFGCSFVQGYGLTETCAAVGLQGAFEPFAPQCVGGVVPSAEVKLVDVPDMNYKSTDKPFPRGEIIVRGTHVSSGYYMQPDLTKEVFSKDGWFSTGDIGQITDHGIIQLIDRKKNLVKLSAGEYIALEKLESVYGNSSFVSPNGIMVYANSEMDQPVALLIPQFTALTTWAKNAGIKELDKDKLCNDPQVVAFVMKSLQEEGKASDLKSFERVCAIQLLHDEWTVENGCLTAAQKLKRNVIAEKYMDNIKKLYSSARQ
jgi:long-chain acyl-CoA synthetase